MSGICWAHLHCSEKTYCGFALGDVWKTSERAAVMDGPEGAEQAVPAEVGDGS